MHPIRKRRLILISWVMLGLSIAVSFALFALKQNINLFYTPSQVLAGEIPANKQFRLGGLVVKGSVHQLSEQLQVEFDLTDMTKTLKVNYSGILPDLFKEGQGIVAEGKLQQGVFVASTVLAKHDENYMPPQVADALKKQGNS